MSRIGRWVGRALRDIYNGYVRGWNWFTAELGEVALILIACGLLVLIANGWSP